MKPFKVGDLVTDIKFGKGEVIEVNDGRVYAVNVDFEDEAITFTRDGKYVGTSAFPTLIHGHHDELEVVPVKPKKAKTLSHE
jgi:hypothetical protein